MDLTQGTTQEKVNRSKKTMMWFAMISMAMVFAGLTSAYVVSKSRKDWGIDLVFPNAFIYSILIIVASSVTFYFVKKAIENNNRSLATLLLLSTLALGIIFIFLQFEGFSDIIRQGYHFTGPTSNIVTTFMFIIVVTHLAHIIGGILVLLVVIYNHFKQKYKTGQTLGLELGAMYWHFVDFLWVYLFLFLYFVK
ncbi:cytochrome c oxidase subunit 3 [Aquimarina sp. EL_43]|uniref:cytochrome c oxidase subunit 3 n=1 Tax=Aquimarina TaxID=290174 RepID=UPI000470BFFC|nr:MULTISPECIES: cytochrome c oxidase subunit 3 [Aquimarina]MBG6132956.1 cytochrome c oxidase subunit 3 [Aquimarina sp. EL_35]MBG6152267.1 cytochrome c oxidase subunit 3 [Aquimarina sp. EL_32]MBG6171105.1 cytochrome c oxidase subunit 3 [Aquimarina sp. EL_43]